MTVLAILGIATLVVLPHLSLLLHLSTLLEAIMSAISDFAAKVDTHLTNIGTHADTIDTNLTGLAGDVAFLKDTITQIQNNPGPISTDDQALLDAVETRLGSVNDRMAAAATAVAALNALTDAPARPVPPPAP